MTELLSPRTPESTCPSSDPFPASPSKVLVVDDEKSIRRSVCEFLREAGYRVAMAGDTQGARDLLEQGDFDVVVSDIVLPGASGVELLKTIRAASPDVQVIMMTGKPTVETASDAVRAGASDYLAKPVAKAAILQAVERAARTKHILDRNKRLREENRRYQENLEQMVRERTTQLNEALEGTIQAMALAIESRDPYTAGHQQRVAELSRAIARRMALTEAEVSAVYHAGLIHDLGKIGVPAEILSHPGRLCDEAMSLVRKHSETGFHILEKVRFPWPLARIVLEHHERMDGSGYPRGLDYRSRRRGRSHGQPPSIPRGPGH